jgi:hypothetical protein
MFSYRDNVVARSTGQRANLIHEQLPSALVRIDAATDRETAEPDICPE